MSFSTFYFKDWCRIALEHLESDVQSGHFDLSTHERLYDQVEDYMRDYMSNCTTYYPESLAIMKEHNTYSWDWLEKNHDCKINNVSDVAYYILYDLCSDDDTFRRFTNYLWDKFAVNIPVDPQEVVR